MNRPVEGQEYAVWVDGSEDMGDMSLLCDCHPSRPGGTTLHVGTPLDPDGVKVVWVLGKHTLSPGIHRVRCIHAYAKGYSDDDPINRDMYIYELVND